jgi:hypothetical protein
MAEHTVTEIVDDLDATSAKYRVVLGLNERVVQLDLSDENYRQLRESLQRFMDAGRHLEIDLIREDFLRHVDPLQIRVWAEANGQEIKGRGRIPGPVLEQYIKAHVNYQG